MRRFAEGTAELAAEVRRRQAGGAREVGDGERLAEAGVGQVFRPQQVAGRSDGGHRDEYRVPPRPESQVCAGGGVRLGTVSVMSAVLGREVEQSRLRVQVLTDADRPDLVRLLDADPEVNAVLASRLRAIRTLAPRAFGGTTYGVRRR